MAEWPDTDELAQHLNLDGTGDWTTTLDRVLATAIETVKAVRGDWDEDVDEPDDKLANAALAMAVLLWSNPTSDARSLIHHPNFEASMFGRRRRFGIA